MSESAGPRLLIRADASTQIGTGHVMRCLALAQAWQEYDGRVVFALATETPPLEARLIAEGMDIIRVSALPGSTTDAAQTAALAQQSGPTTWVVADGYHFDTVYQETVKESGCHLLFLDDYGHADHYYADVVLNQNIYASEELYTPREPYTCLLLGTRYALLRREFWAWRVLRREIPSVAHRVLVTLGGSDPDNVTLKVIRALQQVELGDLETVVLVGASNPHYETLQSELCTAQSSIRLEQNVADIPALMAWADVCVSAGGSTCWETAFMRLPSLTLVLAENQRLVAEGLDAAGVALNLGWHKGVSCTAIAENLSQLLMARDIRMVMAQNGRRLVDGEGGHRVATHMLPEASMHARLAAMDDMQLLFQWANDPLTRRMSFDSKPIAWEDHQRWFKNIVSGDGAILMIVERKEQERWVPIGQVRIDDEGVVSISLSPQHRGRGLAAQVLRTGIDYYRAAYCARLDTEFLTAYIKSENRASQRIFDRVGFEMEGWDDLSGQSCLKYVYRLIDDGSDSPSDRKGGVCSR